MFQQSIPLAAGSRPGTSGERRQDVGTVLFWGRTWNPEEHMVVIMEVAMDPPNLQLFMIVHVFSHHFHLFLIVLTQHTYSICQPQRTRCATPSAPPSPAGTLAIRAAISRSFASQLKSGWFLGCGENACFLDVDSSWNSACLYFVMSFDHRFSGFSAFIWIRVVLQKLGGGLLYGFVWHFLCISVSLPWLLHIGARNAAPAPVADHVTIWMIL